MLELDLFANVGGFELEPKFEMASSRLALFGASGSGKSLTLEAIAGLLTPQRGRIYVNDVPLFDSDINLDLKPQARAHRLCNARLSPLPAPHGAAKRGL